MSEKFLFFVSKSHTIVLILIKISLLLKYFLFIKYKQADWKLQHMVFFAENDIVCSSCFKQAKIKKLQNSLSLAIIHLALIVILIRIIISIFF